MYHKTKKHILFLSIFSLIIVPILLILCTSCSGEYAENNDDYIQLGARNVSFVYSNRMNSAASPNDDILVPYLKAALENDGEVSIVCADGAPTNVTFDTSFFKQSKKANDQNRQKEDSITIDRFIQQLKDTSAKPKGCTAVAEECDLITAISTAAKLLPDKPDKTNTVFVIDSGIATKGRFSLNKKEFWNVDVDNYIFTNCPNLSNVDEIVWAGFNSTCDLQDPIPTDNNMDEYVKILYEKFLQCSGVRNNYPIVWLANSSGCLPSNRQDLPIVSQVNFDKENFIW